MAIPAKNVLGNPNVTEGNFQIAIEQLRDSVNGSGKAYDSANTYSQYDTCVYNGVVYYSKINSNTGNTPTIGANWGDIADLISAVVHKSGNESIDGVKTFTSSPIVPAPTVSGNIITMDNIIQKTAVGIGYGTGAGGTVTQLTSKSTPVTLNKPSGQIVMNNAALAAGAGVSFGVANSLVTSSDNIIVSHQSVGAGSGIYSVGVDAITTGAFGIYVKNTGGASLSEDIVLNFTIIKGANA